jgi:hypothetical protein
MPTDLATVEALRHARSEVRNATSEVPRAAAYDRQLAGRVLDHYRRDFREFGYSEDSWTYL